MNSPFTPDKKSKTVVPSEEELLARAQAGDRNAFAELVQHYGPKLYRLSRYLCDNHPEDAEDTLQTALLKAYANLGQFRAEAKFSTWLTRIAVNECLMRLRQKQSTRGVSLDEMIEVEDDEVPRQIADWDNPEQRYSRGELETVLQTAINNLKPILRTAFVLVEIKGLALQEAADTLKIPLPTLKTRLHRARLELQRFLTDFFCASGNCDWHAFLPSAAEDHTRGLHRAAS